MSDQAKTPWFHPIGNLLLRVAYALVLELDIRGMELAPRTGPLIIVINHTHFLDPVIPCALLRPDVYPMAKIELLEGKWGWVFKGYGAFPVRRGEADVNALKQSLRVLRAGHAMLMAPEGTRAREGGMQVAHEGVGLIAARTGAPVLPIALWGGRAMGPQIKRLKTTLVHVRVHPPLVVRPGESKPSREVVAEITREIMLTLATMLPPEYRGVYSDIDSLAYRYLLPYHGASEQMNQTSKEVMPLTS